MSDVDIVPSDPIVDARAALQDLRRELQLLAERLIEDLPALIERVLEECLTLMEEEEAGRRQQPLSFDDFQRMVRRSMSNN
jgi:hypothetical protein